AVAGRARRRTLAGDEPGRSRPPAAFRALSPDPLQQRAGRGRDARRLAWAAAVGMGGVHCRHDRQPRPDRRRLELITPRRTLDSNTRPPEARANWAGDSAAGE